MVRRGGSSRRVSLALIGLLAVSGLLVPGLGAGQPSAVAASCWETAITEQWSNLELIGSVLRVSVWGKNGLPVVVRSLGGFETVGYTGTKPEYGPFVAEFAPLSEGIYFIEPQGLGKVFQIWLDGRNYTRVNFTSKSCPPTPTPTPRPATATLKPTAQVAPTRQPAARPTSAAQPTAAAGQPSTRWQSRIAQQLKNQSGVALATIAVRVIGRPAGQAVEIRSAGWSSVAKTGTKPEHGPDACEFGGLQPGTYQLVPLDLGVTFGLTVERGDFLLVEFYPITTGGAATRWVGSVTQNTSAGRPTEHVHSAIAVIVAGKPWHEVEIRSDGWSSTAKTGYKPEYGPDACEFGALRAGTYTITPAGLGASLAVTVDGWGWALVRFDQVPVRASPSPRPTLQPTRSAQPGSTRAATATAPAPTPTPAGPRWSGRVVSNSSGQQAGTGISSVIVVKVPRRPGLPVTITGGGGWSATCTTGTKPEYGPAACEFGGLWPGTYTLRPEGSDVQVAVTMDGQGIAFVGFTAP